MDWIIKHKVLAIILAVVLAVAAWYFLSGSSAPPTVLSNDQTNQAPQGTEQMVQSLLALQAVTLDSTLFSDPSYQILKDYTTPIAQEPAGRPDPFAPIGAGAAVTTNVSTNAPATPAKH